MFRCWTVATNFRGKLSLRRENISEKKTTFAKVTFNSAPYNPTKSQLENVTNKRKTILNLSGWVEWRCLGRLTLRDLFGKPPCGLLWVGKLKISLVLYHEVGWHFLWTWWLLDMRRAFVNLERFSELDHYLVNSQYDPNRCYLYKNITKVCNQHERKKNLEPASVFKL